jgi:hypothetical protein
MPGYDGTGPRGEGPMTGKGNGYCIMRLPDDPREPCRGLTGLTGRPLELPPGSADSGATALAAEIAHIQSALETIEHDLENLRALARRLAASDPGDTSDEPTTPTGGGNL